METDGKGTDLNDIINAALDNPAVPNLYTNGFVTATGHGDLLLVFQQNGRSVATLNLSFTVAKTLTLKLGSAIRDLEKATGNAIMLTEDVERAIKEKGDDETNGQPDPEFDTEEG